MDNHAFRAVNEVAKRFPRHDPAAEPLRVAVASQRERVDWSLPDLRLAAARALRGDGVRASRASTPWRPCARPRAALERHPVSFPIELRFSAADDALLSPAHGATVAFVAVHVFKGMAYEAAFREVEAALGELGGRPHWGKRSFLGAAELAPRYPRWDAFQALPRTSSTPTGRFANAWVRDVLG